MRKLNRSRSRPKTSTPPADAAIAEAIEIVKKAYDDVVEIDWTSNPKTKHEAALRLAMIRQIEHENAKAGDDCAAFFTLLALEHLASVDADATGEDLYAAIERWRAASDDEHRRRQANGRRRLLDAARRKIDGEPPS